MAGVSGLHGSIRWAFNTMAWNPSEEEWLLASRCVPLEEKERIQRFVFKADAKASLVGCLMIRKLAHLATGEPYNQISIVRDLNRRPYMRNMKFPMDFNVSHQGNYTVLAAEVNNNIKVGVDVVDFPKKTKQEALEVFRLMQKTFSKEEWRTIFCSKAVENQYEMFSRLWCLKESYTKVLGGGICTDLQRISFQVKSIALHVDKATSDTTVWLDGTEDPSYRFHEWLLDSQHCISVALSTSLDVQPVPFILLSWMELIQEAEPLLPPDINYCKEFMKKEERAEACN